MYFEKTCNYNFLKELQKVKLNKLLVGGVNQKNEKAF